VHLVRIINKLARLKRGAAAGNGRDPTAAELAAHLGLTSERCGQILQYGRDPVSLDLDIGDGDAQLGEFIEDSEAIDVVDVVSFTLLQGPSLPPTGPRCRAGGRCPPATFRVR